MDRELLVHTLYILGATQDPDARSVIESFLQHPDAEVRDEARRAAAEITAVESEGRTPNC